MNTNKETIISQLYDGTLTISKVPKEFKKDPDVLKAYETLKNQKLLNKVLNKIEKKSDISDLKDSPDLVFRSPEVIKAVLRKNIYSQYKDMLDTRKKDKLIIMEKEYKKFVSSNPELFNDIPELKKTMLWCGYDIIANRFIVVEELRCISDIYYLDSEKSKFNCVFLSFDVDDTSNYRFYKINYCEFTDLKDFIEYLNANNYDIYSNSCFKYYEFTQSEIKKYKIDEAKLKKYSIIDFVKYASFYDMKAKFEDSAKDIEFKKIYEDDFYIVQFSGVSNVLNEPLSLTIKFRYFFEFENFLRGDLSDADLIFCENLEKLSEIKGLSIDFTNAHVIKKVRDKLHIAPVNLCKDIAPLNDSDVAAEEFYVSPEVNSTDLSVMDEERELVYIEHISSNEYKEYKENIFYYCSDLHLADRFNILKLKGECITYEDEKYEMYKIVEKLLSSISNESSSLKGCYKFLLINGDVSRDYHLFCLFISLIKRYIKKNKICLLRIIFTFGNREILGMNQEELSSLETLIKESGMYLLQNEILLIDKNNLINVLDAKILKNLKKNTAKLQYILSRSKSIILGGSGFHVKNSYYPDIKSDEFEILYSLLTKYAANNNVIIMSHYPPIKDSLINKESFQCEYRELQPGFIYVHGHTHNNFYYNDGTIAIYADCQLYANEKTGKVSAVYIKQFYSNNSFDLFSNKKDGIYKISKEDYIDYMRGKNITMQLNREINKLYLIKKQNYHCFIHDSYGTISIMDGGRMKKIPEAHNIQYIYDNMDTVISIIEQPLSVFDKLLNHISRIIKKIGGTGKIHGCIIDIDYFNHIYVNPHDQTITPYSALSMKDKVVYPNIASLIENESRYLYDNLKSFLLKINDDTSHDLASFNNIFYLDNGITEPKKYESTDIYSDSFKIKKMQKLNEGILAVWYDPKSFRKNEELNKVIMLSNTTED